MTLGLVRSGSCGPQRGAPAPAPQLPQQLQGSAEEEPLPDILGPQRSRGSGAVSPAQSVSTLTA